MVIELVVPIIKGANNFSIQLIVFTLGGKMLIFGYWVKTIPAGSRFAAPAGKNKHHIFTPTAGARCAIFPKLCMLIELVETIKNVAFIFDPTHSFSYRVHGKFRPN